jgi:hypothetical protein
VVQAVELGDYPNEDDEAQSPGLASPPVLVVVLTNPRDLEIARTAGWYRIPAKRSPRKMAAEYLAFYQTRTFGDEKWAIHYYAPIRRYRLTSRLELLPHEPQHPRARDPYYKIEIGPLERLPHPIPSRSLRRITFIMTDLRHLLAAEEINDLWLKDGRQELLWQEMQRRQIEAERRVQVREGRATYTVDFAIPCVQGNLAVQVGPEVGALPPLERLWSGILRRRGWRVLRVPLYELETALPECLERLMAEIGGLGGQVYRGHEATASPEGPHLSAKRGRAAHPTQPRPVQQSE